MSEKLRTNDAKGLGPAIRAGARDGGVSAGPARPRQDRCPRRLFQPRDTKEQATGRDEAWHYKWDERPDAGYYAWGTMFRELGAGISQLSAAPDAKNLAGASIYIIVDPDTDKETAKPNFVEPQHVKGDH